MSAHKSRTRSTSPASPASTGRRDAIKKTAAMGAAVVAGSLGFPAIVTKPGLSECLYWRWLPLVLASDQPTSSILRTASRTFTKSCCSPKS